MAHHCATRYPDSLSHYTECQDTFKATGKPPLVPSIEPILVPNTSTWMEWIQSLSEQEIVLYVSILTLLIGPLLYSLRRIQSESGYSELLKYLKRTGTGITLLYLIYTNMDPDYKKAHIEHMGHPPLWGPYPPMDIVMYTWIFISIGDLILVNIRLFIFGYCLTLEYYCLYIVLIDKLITFLYWKEIGLGVLFRIIIHALVTIIRPLLLSAKGDEYNVKVFGSELVLVHMPVALQMLYKLFMLNGNASPVATSEAAWFKVPNEYTRFTIYELVIATGWMMWCVLILYTDRQVKKKQA